jgi:RimJ/RimL family protein N-acetyltransferase
VIPLLTTERLILRPYQAADLDPIAAMMTDPAVMRHIGNQTHPREDAWRRMLCGPGMWLLLGYGYWAVERRSDGALIGQLGFADFKRGMTPSIEGLPELGYVFAAEAHGQGYGFEGAAAALRWADEQLTAPEIVAIIDPGNAPSIRVAEKSGFTFREPATYKGEDILLFRRPLLRANAGGR